ncbi:MAG: deaminase [Ktedonobacteraceae bacterium]
MCAGALVQARVTRLIYGADDPKGGAVRTCLQVKAQPRAVGLPLDDSPVLDFCRESAPVEPRPRRPDWLPDRRGWPTSAP